ncbi:XTP/dITP diphosphatase [Catenovulum sp. SM1970]|uniref:XTP/dITP diphosphatase n=1 Tax=Marinifaba aquimaris TaxID=2741323 RepID=UPI001571E0DF|nr:XTP/dITP diphosphatase [Marinifaba aquimaris]NTS76433.1 XTP/dITP diphosphatase [Marinifaba aquimaris]
MTIAQKIVLATGNKGKVKELSKILAPLNFEVLPQSEFNVVEAEETGTTFVENAIIKARNAAKATGLPAIADDSGIEVDYLKGAPGIYSARYAGEGASDSANLEKLLTELKGVPAQDRTARFQCVIVYMQHADDPTPIICQGSWEGTITEDISGENGFGYDPIFFQPELNCTAADLAYEQKNAMSHRGKALAQLMEQLK